LTCNIGISFTSEDGRKGYRRKIYSSPEKLVRPLSENESEAWAVLCTENNEKGYDS
jgi:hypothetical protein